MIAASTGPRRIATAHQQARQDGYRGPLAVVPLRVGTEPELGRSVELRKARRAPARPTRQAPEHRVAFEAFCAAILECIPSGEGVRAHDLFAAARERCGATDHRRIWRALVRLVDRGRVKRDGKRYVDTTYRRNSP